MTLKEQLEEEINAFTDLYDDRSNILQKLENGDLSKEEKAARIEIVKSQMMLALDKIKEAQEALRAIKNN